MGEKRDASTRRRTASSLIGRRPPGGGTRQLTPAHWHHLSPVAVMAGQEDPVQREIHQDWANREYIEVITSSIKKIADFLNSFGQCGGGFREVPGLCGASLSSLPRVHPGISGLIRVLRAWSCILGGPGCNPPPGWQVPGWQLQWSLPLLGGPSRPCMVPGHQCKKRPRVEGGERGFHGDVF